MNDYEALLHQAKRLEALQEIRNLMGRYSYLHSAFRNKEYAELWAKETMTDWSCLLENSSAGKQSDIVMWIFTATAAIRQILTNCAD